MKRLLALAVVFAFTILAATPIATATQRTSPPSEKIVEKIDLRPMVAKLMRERQRDGLHVLHKADNGVTAFANIEAGQLVGYEFQDEKGEELPYEEEKEEGELPDPEPRPDDGCPEGKSNCTITVTNPDGSETLYFACC